MSASTGKGGFRPLKVIDKVRESSTITSFHLEPAEPGGWRAFEAGQFLVFKFPADNERGHVLRTYSVSCAPGHPGRYRISVKRETAPMPGLPDGLGSCYLHDRVQVGDVLMADGPRGDFYLDRLSARPVVLLSGGVGLTPMVAMLHALAEQSDRRTVFIHACDNGEVHALGDEVRTLAGLRSGIDAHVIYRFPTEADRAAARFQAEGVITRELLQRLLPLDDYEFYLCGPPPFMQAVFRLVRSLGVAKERIAYEFFGPATVLEPDAALAKQAPQPAAAQAPSAPAGVTTAGAESAITVTFRKSGRSASWVDGAESLLSFAESHGLAPEFSCRAGVCGTCKTGLVDGEVNYFEEPLDDPGAGQVLICCARPKGNLVLDL
ncbi:2Fe-2S iron-sulfur cluster-binding protein [Hydrogenophaga sp. PAMC20947]|uniref:2Fe-2S iron-sulfur cluster-binding protein n=1 Tax=Hydrogenophaga sp. PAMC20947 TaxID=2565558 RepID=UPI00109E1B11|nr:2Fe-2S iron-sulfur cluster-binding protein [Hydrogenophaga sp. PAMC20947]QCB45846.1 2Fe-2S iron-sulfur cluster binding domain-containing protein [Hydrogenophaga sp. PAMC20947]